MSDLADSIKFMKDYITNATKDVEKSLASSDSRSKYSPQGQLINQVSTAAQSAATDAVATNPILNSGGTLVSQYLNSTVGAMVKDVVTKTNLAPIENMTQQFFTLFASVTTFGTEVALEFSRNTARNIGKILDERDGIATELSSEVNNLYNCSVVLLNGSPVFNQILSKVITAQSYIKLSRTELQQTVDYLTNKQKFLVRTYDQAVKNMAMAQTLLLPDDSSTLNVRSITDLVDSIEAEQSTKNIVAAAANIPLISQRIGVLLLKYIQLTMSSDALISIFLTALNDFINSYKQNNNLNQATIDHINAANNQIDSILDSINAVLSKNPNSPNDIKYKALLTANTSQWGLRVAAVVSWLKLNPGAGSIIQAQTSDGVAKYDQAVKTIKAMNDVGFIGGTFKVSSGIEDADQITSYVTPLLQSANTILATNTSRKDMRTQANTVKNYLAVSKSYSGKVRAALSPFISSGGDTLAKRSVQGLLNYANSINLDRAVALLQSGDVKSLFAMTPATATQAGATVFALNTVITGVQKKITTTDDQIDKLTQIRDQFEREKKSKEIEGSRSSSATVQADQDQQKASLDKKQKTISYAVATADTLEADASSDPLTRSSDKIGSIVPGFNENRDTLIS